MGTRGLVALWASAAAHAVLVLLAWTRDEPPRPIETRQAPIALIETVDVTPIEVVMLPDRVDAGVIAPVRSASGDRGGSSSKAIAARTSGSEPSPGPEPAPPPTPTPTPTPTPPVMLRLPTGAIQAIVDRPDLPPPHVPATSGKLVDAGGGTKVAQDAVTALKVDADGTAHFADKTDVDIHFAVPSRRILGAILEDWYDDPYKQLESPPIQDLPQHEQAVPGGWDSGARRGSIASETAENGIVPIVSGGFDLTSWVMRAAGDDPYRARKQRLLEDTFDERAEQRANHTAEQRDRTEQLVRANLARLWRATVDPVERRLALFELWDECEEGEGPAAEAGERARRQVLAWIRAKLPAGSTDAYAPEELEKLNASRKSKRLFSPYSR
jgi:hypothetical protein